MNYVVITPVRNEAAHLPETVRSLASQSARPREWVIVNDGSTDSTGEIADQAAAAHAWIHVVHRGDRGCRKPGTGVVEAFDEGYRALESRSWDYLVKLDGDLSFQPDYFARCFEQFSADPKLGLGGGSIYHVIGGKPVLEPCPAFHVRGATKIYRRTCWNQLGGLHAAPGWDTLDEVKARMLGWNTRTFPELTVIHHRYTGTAEGIWAGLVKNGRANYFSGYHPLFMVAKCLARCLRPPVLAGSIALAYGFLRGYFERAPQVNDPELVRYLRAQQLSRLAGRQTIWR